MYDVWNRYCPECILYQLFCFIWVEMVGVIDSFLFSCSPLSSSCVLTAGHFSTLSESFVIEFEVFGWMHLFSGIFRRYSSRVIVPLDSTVAEPFVLRCLAKASKLPRVTNRRQDIAHASIALDTFLFATQGTIIAQQQSQLPQLPQLHHLSQLPQLPPLPIQNITDDNLKDTLIPILYYKCNLDALNAMMDRLDKQYYEQSKGESQWGFCVFWTSARGALTYVPS